MLSNQINREEYFAIVSAEYRARPESRFITPECARFAASLLHERDSGATCLASALSQYLTAPDDTVRCALESLAQGYSSTMVARVE